MSITYLADFNNTTPRPCCTGCGQPMKKRQSETRKQFAARVYCSRRCVFTYSTRATSHADSVARRLSETLDEIESARAAGLDWVDVAYECGKAPRTMARYLYRHGRPELAVRFESAGRQQVAA